MGAVWLAEEPLTSNITCYDAALFINQEVPAVISHGMAARGRDIPVAWHKKDKGMAKSLEEAGVDMIYEPSEDDKTMADVRSREIWQAIRSGRFFVEKRLGDVFAEFKAYMAGEQKGYPLISAIRYALERLDYAQADSVRFRTKKNHPGIKVI